MTARESVIETSLRRSGKRSRLMSPTISASQTSKMDRHVEDSLKGIEEEMQQVLATREKILKTSRDSISLCSKAIIHIHTGKIEEAQQEIKEAGRILKGLRKEAGGGP